MQRDPGAGDRGGAGAAVGLDHVAIDGDLPLAERGQIEHRAQAAADQPLDLDGAAALLAGRRLAARALRGGARQHAVFGGDPAARLALEPGRQPVLERRRHQHVGVAELHEAGAFGVFHHAALERYGAQLVGLSAARPHAHSPARRRRTGQAFRGERRDRQGATCLLRLDPGVLDHLGPFDELDLDEVAEFLGRARERLEAHVGQLRLDLRIVDDLAQFAR